MNKNQDFEGVYYPAIIERFEENPRYYNVYFPDFDESILGFGLEEAHLMAQDLLRTLLESEDVEKKPPSSKDELLKQYPGKKIYAITPAVKKYVPPTSPSTHYLVLKIVKSSETNFNVSEVIEVNDPFDKIVLYLTLLKHCDLEEGYTTEPAPLFNEDTYKSEKCSGCSNAQNCHWGKYDEIRNLLYSLKEPLIDEYAKSINSDKESEEFLIDQSVFLKDCFSCCKMFNMGHTGDEEDCMCGFYSYKTIKKQLDELNCFDNLKEFAKKFLSPEYKFVALKLDYCNDINLWQYINE